MRLKAGDFEGLTFRIRKNVATAAEQIRTRGEYFSSLLGEYRGAVANNVTLLVVCARMTSKMALRLAVVEPLTRWVLFIILFLQNLLLTAVSLGDHNALEGVGEKAVRELVLDEVAIVRAKDDRHVLV